MNRSLIVIPARMGSTRFPGKPLVELFGKPMIQWVYEAARQVGDTVIATPDHEIMEAGQAFGARVALTSPHHRTGTDRIAEVAQAIEADFYVNVQGDEPLIEPKSIRDCLGALTNGGEADVASVWAPCPIADEDNPAVVKVVLDRAGHALYFSRFPIPNVRSDRPALLKKHVGLYAFTRDALLKFSHWEPGELEKAESLEQLRFLENGLRVAMVRGESAIGVDTPEQAEAVAALLAAGEPRNL
ncbi:MAG: 3-deoxy-manno-octulosonate cytidylyltransferase [Chthonomonadaceae bacterium]|nr:3-deoxy-manno-octulosonate cytidylyltransferase [Chthonomonadaceae bacterium]